MASAVRVLNTTRHFHMKHNQALRAVESCACAWVDFGVSVRDLTLAEAIERRAKAKKPGVELPYSELRSVVYRPPERQISQTRMGYSLVREANQFAAMQGL